MQMGSGRRLVRLRRSALRIGVPERSTGATGGRPSRQRTADRHDDHHFAGAGRLRSTHAAPPHADAPFPRAPPDPSPSGAGTQLGVGAGLSRCPTAVPRNHRIRALGGRDYRAWGGRPGRTGMDRIRGMPWYCSPEATAVFAAVDRPHLGPSCGGAWFPPKAVWSSPRSPWPPVLRFLVLVGMLLVELRLTGAFFWVFLAMGALSLAVQIGSFVNQIVTFRPRTFRPAVGSVDHRRKLSSREDR